MGTYAQSQLNRAWIEHVARRLVAKDPDHDGPLIPGADGLRGRQLGTAIVLTGPCGQRHVLGLSAGRALARWLEQHCAASEASNAPPEDDLSRWAGNTAPEIERG